MHQCPSCGGCCHRAGCQRLNTNDKAMWVLGWNECLNAQPPAPSEAAREYMTGYSDGREWAKPSQALVVEPVYQYQLANGNWIDQTKESYDYNVKHGQATVRMLYATPQAAPLYAKEQQ